MVMAQNPESAEYDGMPRAPSPPAWWTMCCRRPRCPPSSIAYVVHALVEQPAGRSAQAAGRREDALKKIFLLLRAQTGHDFSQYKQSTIVRRVERRMAVHQIERVDEYAALSAADSGGSGGAVSRPPDRRHQLLPRPGGLRGAGGAGHPAAVRRQARDGPIRVWVPGCSTGEEAYSIAILLAGAHGGAEAEFQGADVRHRHRQPGHRAGPRRRLPGQHRRRHLAGAAGQRSSRRSRTAAPTASRKASATWWSSPSRT